MLSYESKLSMADMILMGRGIQPTAWQEGEADAQGRGIYTHNLCEAIKHAQFFDISNVADYYYFGTPQEEWLLHRDFPCVAPPFRSFWMEYRTPKKLWSEVTGRRDMSDRKDLRWGFMFDVEEPRTFRLEEMTGPATVATVRQQLEYWASKVSLETFRQKMAAYKATHPTFPESLAQFRTNCAALGFTFAEETLATLSLSYNLLHQYRNESGPIAEEVQKKMPRWYIVGTAFVLHKEGVFGPAYRWTVGVCEDGTIKPGDDYYHAVFIGKPGTSAQMDIAREMVDGLAPTMHPCLMALVFLNCKNVKVEEGESATTISEQHRRRYGSPLIRFKTLRIEPMQEIIRKNYQPGDGEKSLHICRGHFKDYRERGLFGKYKGVYWWDANLRGQARKGIVIKDYDFGPPPDIDPSAN